MLSLVQAQACETRRSRPAVAIVRRFSAQGNLTDGAQHLSDLGVLRSAIQDSERAHGVSMEMALLPETGSVLHVGNENGRCKVTSRGTPLTLIDLWNGLSSLAKHAQLLLIAGAVNGASEKENRTACIDTIRRIRRHRPTVYAQFICWQTPALSSEMARQRHD